MRPPNKAGLAFAAVGSLVFAFAMLTAFPGTVAAQGNKGSTDFCDPNVYDNNKVTQTYGLFTDIPHTSGSSATDTTFRPTEINAYNSAQLNQVHGSCAVTGPNWDEKNKPGQCALSFDSYKGHNTNGHIGDMWGTILAAPGNNPPVASCWSFSANIWVANSKTPDNPDTCTCVVNNVLNNACLGNRGGTNDDRTMGFITNYNPATRQGLYFGLTVGGGDGASMYLAWFDVSTDYPGHVDFDTFNHKYWLLKKTIIPKPTYNTLYTLRLNIGSGKRDPNGSGPVLLTAVGSVQPTIDSSTGLPNIPGTCPLNAGKDQYCFVYQGLLPAPPDLPLADTVNGKIANIPTSGAAGIAAVSLTGFPDGYLTNFTWVAGNCTAD